MSRGWNSVWERELAACRANLASNPDEAAIRAERLLAEARTNDERVRATLTLAGVEMARGRPEKCREVLEQAGRYHRPGPLARSDLATHWGWLHLNEGGPEPAAVAADRAVELAEPLAVDSPRYRRSYRAKSVVPKAIFAAALITRAEARLRQGMTAAAFADALAALSWVDPRFSPHVHVSAISCLSSVLITPGVATPALAQEVLRLCRWADRILAARRVKRGSPHRAKIRGLEALAVAILGSLEQAEKLLQRTVRDLRNAGLENDARLALRHMLWVIGVRAGQVGRARLLAQRHDFPVSPARKRKKPPPKDDPPIGF